MDCIWTETEVDGYKRRIAEQKQQLAEARAEVDRLQKLHDECPAAQAMEFRRGMQRAAEIADLQANRDMVSAWTSCAKRIARYIRAEIKDKNQKAYERHWINRGMERAAEIADGIAWGIGGAAAQVAKAIRTEIKDKNQKG